MRRFPRLLASVLAAGLTLAACSDVVETDQARLCRRTLPALLAPDADIKILSEREATDRRGVEIAFDAGGAAHRILCRFRRPGRPDRSEDLVALKLDDAPLSSTRLYFLIRFWLATPEAVGADPSPLGDVAALPQIPLQAAYALQQGLNGLPLAAVYALLAAAYSLVYGLIGRINLAFGPLAAAGGYGAAFGALAMAGGPPGPILAVAFVYAVFVAATWGYASSRFVFRPLANASGQIGLLASIGLALFLTEGMRLTQGAELHWVSPVLNQPFGVARAGEFVVTVTPNGELAAALALAFGVALIALMRLSDFGRRWRAYADDPLAAEMFGVDAGELFALTFVLASGLAGVAGFVMTLVYGAVGYGAAMTLGLKALTAAILGGVGSIPGAFLGGLMIGGFEALWSAAFPIDYRDVAVFAGLAVLLALRPSGLLGRADAAR